MCQTLQWLILLVVTCHNKSSRGKLKKKFGTDRATKVNVSQRMSRQKYIIENDELKLVMNIHRIHKVAAT